MCSKALLQNNFVIDMQYKQLCIHCLNVYIVCFFTPFVKIHVVLLYFYSFKHLKFMLHLIKMIHSVIHN